MPGVRSYFVCFRISNSAM